MTTSAPLSFTEARQRAGLTQRQTAQILGVEETTVQRWESGRPIPDDALTVIRRLAGEDVPDPDILTTYGQILAVYASCWPDGELPPSVLQLAFTLPVTGLQRIQQITDRLYHDRYREVHARVDALKRLIPLGSLPPRLVEVDTGQVWLGYYHERGGTA